MAADGEAVAGGFSGIVDQMEGRAPHGGAGQFDPAAWRGQGAAPVMIPGDQRDMHFRMGGPPLFHQFEDGGGLGSGGVEKIAADDNFACLSAVQHAGEPCEIIGGMTFGNGHAVMPQVRGFAEVQIRQQQDPGFLPKGTAFRKQLQGLPAQDQGRRMGHTASLPPPIWAG